MQRVRIAMAIVHKPTLLIVDEPTRGLDPIAKMEILEVLSQLHRKLGMSILCLSRDLITTATICHRIAILQNGIVVEVDTREAVMTNPRHEHTKTLLASAARRPLLYQKGDSALA
jgi:ABC-type dipeptide/oligopeptide/nickel transport system ATPase component